MDEESEKQSSKFGRLIWLIVLVAIVVLWWYYRGRASDHEVVSLQGDVTQLAGAEHDEILVDLKDDATPDAIEQALGIQLTLVDDTAKDTKLYRAKVDPAREAEIIAALAARDDVEIAEPDSMMGLSPNEEAIRFDTPDAATEPGFPNDPDYKYQWHLKQIGMPDAWKLADGNGVVVAVLDTGVGYENYKNIHVLPDLAGIEFVKPYNFVGNNTHAGDDHGHGSHVTGTIAQVTNNGIGVAGVTRNVRIMPLKVLSAGGSGSVAGIADAIRYAADNGAKVINMSLGGPFPSKVLQKAVKYAHDKGVTVICAAGNESKKSVGYPAAYPGAIAVSATQFDESITFYSNTGKDIDIAAPGGNTQVDQNGDGKPDGVLQNTIVIGDPTKDGYFAFMGTSMASPHAAGVAALVVGEGVTNPDAVEKILKKSARKPTDQKYDELRYGAGIIDAPAAVKAARSSGGGFQLGLGALMAMAIAGGVRRNKRIPLGAGFVAGTVLGACGLFFLPELAPSVSSMAGIHALTHGLPSWDLGVMGTHGSMLFFSALIPAALLVVGYGTRFRGALAGLAIGVAAHLAFFAAVPMIAGVSAIWLGVNALVCLGLAAIAIRK